MLASRALTTNNVALKIKVHVLPIIHCILMTTDVTLEDVENAVENVS